MSSAYFKVENNRLVPANSISTLDSGLRYANGVFETILFANGHPYLWTHHMNRMLNSLKFLKIAEPNADQILSLIQHEIAIRGRGLLKIIVTGGNSKPLGYSSGETAPTVIIELHPQRSLPDLNVSLCFSKMIRCGQPEILKMKTLQGVASVMAKKEALEQGCFDSILLNTFNNVCETSSGNIFYYKNGKLSTPALECGLLNGIMRKRIIEKSPYPVVHSICRISDLLNAESVFITNVSWIALNVSSIKSHKNFPNNGIADEIRSIIEADTVDQCT